jgi:hypothetical protein
MLRLNNDYADNGNQDCHVGGERQWTKRMANWTFLTEAVGHCGVNRASRPCFLRVSETFQYLIAVYTHKL